MVVWVVVEVVLVGVVVVVVGLAFVLVLPPPLCLAVPLSAGCCFVVVVLVGLVVVVARPVPLWPSLPLLLSVVYLAVRRRRSTCRRRFPSPWLAFVWAWVR